MVTLRTTPWNRWGTVWGRLVQVHYQTLWKRELLAWSAGIAADESVYQRGHKQVSLPLLDSEMRKKS